LKLCFACHTYHNDVAVLMKSNNAYVCLGYLVRWDFHNKKKHPRRTKKSKSQANTKTSKCERFEHLGISKNIEHASTEDIWRCITTHPQTKRNAFYKEKSIVVRCKKKSDAIICNTVDLLFRWHAKNSLGNRSACLSFTGPQNRFLILCKKQKKCIKLNAEKVYGRTNVLQMIRLQRKVR